jgi:hypothetical protein
MTTHIPLRPSPRKPRFAHLRRCVVLTLTVSAAAPIAVPTALAQPSATPSTAMQQLPPEMLRQMEAAGGPAAEGVARLKRMSDPNAGKRAGDEKLSCDQIKAEFEETDRRYTVQSEKQDAANTAVEAEALRSQAESSGPAAITKGFVVGLAAITAQVTGNGDAFNEKLKADLLTNEARKQAVLNQSAQQAEATKALADRGETLMRLSKNKGCKGLAIDLPPKQLP